jgi:hypothetical protein
MNRLAVNALPVARVAAAAILAGCAGSPSRLTQDIDRPVYLAAGMVIGPGYRHYPDYEVFYSTSQGHFVD